MYIDIAKLIKWVIIKEIHFERPELVLLYYPSIFSFYWFISRAYAELETHKLKLPFKEMVEVYSILNDILPTVATE